MAHPLEADHGPVEVNQPHPELISLMRPTERDTGEERYAFLPLREIDLRSHGEMSKEERERAMQDMRTYYRLLTNARNIEHFARPPVSPEDLREKLLNDRTHAYVLENGLGEIVAAGGINDAEPGQHDHFLVKIAVDPRSQGQGVGRRFLIKLIDKGFGTRTRDGRERDKLDAAVIEGPKDWGRMVHLMDGLGFRHVSRLPRQVDVFSRKDNAVVRLPTNRYELLREDWEWRRPQLAERYSMPVDGFPPPSTGTFA